MLSSPSLWAVGTSWIIALVKEADEGPDCLFLFFSSPFLQSACSKVNLLILQGTFRKLDLLPVPMFPRVPCT
ncbi:hypothetical protein DAI22_08g117600 [Oryza sativa Japonica Group]|nr:hypothetical protein DAI22_08g117600 [Oryza sativa Japonica Group]